MDALALGGQAPHVTTSATIARRAGPSRLAMAVLWGSWGLSAAIALGFLMQPVGASAQLALCGVAGAGMLSLWLFFPSRGLPRMAFLALGSLVVLRYVYWRVAGTLPGIDDPVSFGLGLVLVAAELYCVLILTISLIINADPLERAAAPALPDDQLPSVDIFIPTYNEGTEILAVTVAAARNLDYPADRFTVWLLDDGGTDQKCNDPNPAKAAAAKARRVELQALCVDLGARYLTRARNEHAKAGNMNSGLKSAKAELVLVLDADHAPFRSFLRETVGLFSTDPKLFLVQTPHVFLNPDPVERNLRTFSRMPSENEMFYSVTQRGLDKWNGSFFCGSAALLRRKALDTVGGFSGITITEDCETAFELHSRGWTSAYVDKPLIAGLQPETFADFIGQRARWCQGMFQIMLLKNPVMKPGLEAIQRLSYLSSMTFWFFPLPRLIFMLAPLLHIFFDVKIFVSSLDEALAFTATYVVANMMIQNYLYGRVRWPWISELYEYVQGVYLARSIVSVLISPRKPSFNVTAKGISLDEDQLSPLAWPYFAIFGALAAGCATATWRYLYEPGVTSLMLVVGLWCLFNLVIAGAALGVVAERRQPERSPSLPTARRGWVSIGTDLFEVAVERASSEGCTLRRIDGASWPAVEAGAGFGHAGIGSLAVLPLPGRTGFEALAFSFRADPQGDTGSVVFEAMSPGSYRALADLMYGDTAPLRAFLDGRRRHQNLLSGSLRFIAWGFAEPVRAFAYAIRALRKTMAPATKAAVLELPLLDSAIVAATQALALADTGRSEERAPIERATAETLPASVLGAGIPADFLAPIVRPAIAFAARPLPSEIIAPMPVAHPAEARAEPKAASAPAITESRVDTRALIERVQSLTRNDGPAPTGFTAPESAARMSRGPIPDTVKAAAPATQPRMKRPASMPPLAAEAWQAAIRELLAIESKPSEALATGLDPETWRSWVQALATAERKRDTKASQPAPAKPALFPAVQPEQVVPEFAPERRDPKSHGAKLRQAA